MNDWELISLMNQKRKYLKEKEEAEKTIRRLEGIILKLTQSIELDKTEQDIVNTISYSALL